MLYVTCFIKQICHWGHWNCPGKAWQKLVSNNREELHQTTCQKLFFSYMAMATEPHAMFSLLCFQGKTTRRTSGTGGARRDIGEGQRADDGIASRAIKRAVNVEAQTQHDYQT